MKRLLCILAATATLAGAQQGPARFASSQQAVDALKAAVTSDGDHDLVALFGPNSLSVLRSGDSQEDANARKSFLADLDTRVELVNERGATFLHVGADGWAFPIPLRESGGQWAFDMKAGAKDLLARRIGRNELNAIDVCRTIAVAEREYYTRDWNGNRVLEYARRIKSTPGHQDGLYWANKPGGLMSPLGPLVASAQEQGYSADKTGPTPYHGYYFRILEGQGKHAPGGAHPYVINGNMIAGFAVLAWPAKWANSGVQTFILGPNGELYERNLGKETADLADQIEGFDPGPGWSLVKEAK